MFIVGAGFDRALGGATPPLNKDLVQQLHSKFSSAEFNAHFESSPANDLEIYLTYLDLEIAEQSDPAMKQALKDLRSWAGNKLAELFSEHRFNAGLLGAKTWPAIFATKVLKKGDSIVQLNYSTLFEGLLDNFGVWSPRDGYTDILAGGVIDTSQVPLNGNLLGIEVFKIHGSENFQQSEILGTKRFDIDVKVDASLFPNSCANSDFGSATAVGPYVIAPSFVKVWHPKLHQLMLKAVDRAGAADNVIIIGCGMRPEDSHLATLLTKFHTRPVKQIGKIVIVDLAASAVEARVNEMLDGVPEFLKNTIIISKDLEQAMPDLLAAL